MKIVLFIGLQFITMAISDFNVFASDCHNIEASALFSSSLASFW